MEYQRIKRFAYAASVLASAVLVQHVISDAADVWRSRWEVGFDGTVLGSTGLPAAMGIASSVVSAATICFGCPAYSRGASSFPK